MNKKLAIIGFLIVALGFIASSSLFVVDETQQALVLQFGEPKRVIQEPGLKAKLPLIQNVIFYDRRVLDLDPPVEQVILADQKRLDVDAFVRYRITEPLRFYQSVGTEVALVQRLNTVVISSLRRVLGNVTLLGVLSEERAAIMDNIREQVNSEAKAFGIDIVDVRIRRADLPEETSQAIFARMRSEREREAAEFRAQGQELAQQIRSRADRERTVILAEAQREAQVLRGEGDNQALRIIAEATSRDPQFYAFYRTLEAYRTSISREDTTLVLSPDSEFFRFFHNFNGQLETVVTQQDSPQLEGPGPVRLPPATATAPLPASPLQEAERQPMGLPATN